MGGDNLMRKWLILDLVAVCSLMLAGTLAHADGTPAKPGKTVRVQVKAEFYELDAKSARSLQAEWKSKERGGDKNEFAKAVLDAAGVKALKARIDVSGATIVNCPILAILNGQRGETSINTVIPYSVERRDLQGRLTGNEQQFIKVKSGFSVLPTVNDDGSITVDFHLIDCVSRLGDANPKDVGAGICAKVCPGGAMALVRVDNRSGKVPVIIVTPRVEDESARCKHGAVFVP
jgi:hypothetical protein